MNEISYQFLKSNLDRLQVGIIYAAYTKCWNTWRELDFVPDYNKLYFICDGDGWVKIGNKDYYPVAGQLVLAPAGILQSYSTISENTYSKYWCHFTARIGDINLFDLVDLPRIIHVDDKARVSDLFEKLIFSHNNSSFSAQFEEKAALMNILGYYFKKYTGTSPIQYINKTRIEKAKLLLKSTDLSITEISDRTGFGDIYHFSRSFKCYTGYSPSDFKKI